MIKKVGVGLLMMMLVTPVFASLKFEESKDAVIIKKKYEKEKVKGEANVEIPAYIDTDYTIYVAPSVTTMVVMPYSIIDPPVFSLNTYTVTYRKNADFFEINPNTLELKGKIANAHIKCLKVVNGETKTFFVNLIIEPIEAASANHTVIFTDGELKKLQDIDYLNETIKKSQQNIDDLKNIISYHNYFEQYKFFVNKTQIYNKTELKLLNISRADNNLFFNFEIVKEDDNYLIELKDIKLRLNKFSKDFFSDSDRDTTIIKSPTNIYPYTDSVTKKKYFSAMFDCKDFTDGSNPPKPVQYFNSEFSIHKDDFIYQSKVDFSMMSNGGGNVFYNPVNP